VKELGLCVLLFEKDAYSSCIFYRTSKQMKKHLFSPSRAVVAGLIKTFFTKESVSFKGDGFRNNRLFIEKTCVRRWRYTSDLLTLFFDRKVLCAGLNIQVAIEIFVAFSGVNALMIFSQS